MLQAVIYKLSENDRNFPRPVTLAELKNSVAPEPEGSSPHSQQPANCPYLEPGESTPHTPQPISLRSIWFHSSIYALVFQVAL
jgi:hypothetical protein